MKLLSTNKINYHLTEELLFNKLTTMSETKVFRHSQKILNNIHKGKEAGYQNKFNNGKNCNERIRNKNIFALNTVAEHSKSVSIDFSAELMLKTWD